MHADTQHIASAVENGLGPVAVVNVEVDNSNAVPLRDGALGAQRRVVHETIPVAVCA
jgi:cobalamin biosynthesis protein CbiG